ncbi:MAG: hypothetical protein HY936_03900 [Nitrosomonadales bacterium]|nr:hypothetical protein [Nitrosomonadales bacterium]
MFAVVYYRSMRLSNSILKWVFNSPILMWLGEDFIKPEKTKAEEVLP